MIDLISPHPAHPCLFLCQSGRSLCKLSRPNRERPCQYWSKRDCTRNGSWSPDQL